MTARDEAIAMVDQPGFPGTLARLILTWNPDAIVGWVQAETARGTPPTVLAQALGEAIAVAMVGLGSDQGRAVRR